MDWREVYAGIVHDLTDATAALGGALHGVSDVHGSAHVLLLTWPCSVEHAPLLVFSKLSQSATGWWGLYVDLYEELAELAPRLRRIALFLTGRTRGFLLDQDRIEYQRDRWDQRTSPAKPPSTSSIARALWKLELGLEPDNQRRRGSQGGYLQYHIYERHLRGAPKFASAAEAADMLAEIALRVGTRSSPRGEPDHK